ncbi:MAG: hypothetical protein QW793_05000, partial [Candidatus Caldarchaeum sp.]
MAILTEPTILRDDNFDSGVLLYLYFGAASPDDRLFVYRYDDDAPFFVAGPDLIAVGVGNAYSDKYIYANTGGLNPPALRYGVGPGQWEYSNDGVNFLPIGGAPVDASYVVLGLNATLTNERVLAVGSSLTLTDGGANGNVTLNTIQDIRTTASPQFAGLQIGPVTPTYPVELNTTSGMANFRYSTTLGGFHMVGRSNSDTVGTKAAMSGAGEIGKLLFACINPATNAWNATAGIVAQATAAHSSNSLPTKLEFYTTDSGSASPAVRMTITERGFVQIGGSAAGMKLSSYHTITDPSDSNIGALYANADVTFNTYSS